MARQKRHRVTVIDQLPRNATPAKREEAERKLALARLVAPLTTDQIGRQQEIVRRGGKFDGKSRNNRSRAAQRNSAKRDQE